MQCVTFETERGCLLIHAGRRKVKCSGEQPGPCNRCREEGIDCSYSSQKAMGRPRKRQRPDVEEAGIEQQQNSFDVDLVSHPLPAFDDWVMPGFDLNGSLNNHSDGSSSGSPQHGFANGIPHQACPNPWSASNDPMQSPMANNTGSSMGHPQSTTLPAPHHAALGPAANGLVSATNEA